MEKTKTTIPLLYDRTGEVMRAWRVAFELPQGVQEFYAQYDPLNLPAQNPDTGWFLPLPATFVVGGDGIIAARHVNADYMRRMLPDEVLAEVRSAAGSSGSSVDPASG